MKLLAFIIRRYLIFSLLFIILPIIVGVVAYRYLPKEGEPEVSAPIALVFTVYAGASPSEIESLVTAPIEEELSGLKDIDELRSESSEGISVVVVEFVAEAELERSLQRVREKMADVRTELPDEAEDPVVEELSFSDIPIMIASVTGDIDPVRLRRLAEDVAREIELLPEVLSADVAGGLEREIQIYLQPERLNQYGLTILDVYNAVKQSDINIPGGQVNVEGRRMLLRSLTEIKRIEDYLEVPLFRFEDRVVFLGDVGTVIDGHSEDVSYSRVSGVPSASIAVKKRAGANILKTSAKVRDKLKELEAGFPSGVTSAVTADRSKFIRQEFAQMNNTAVAGLFIVIVVLYFAMGLRNAVITGIAIPLTLLLTFIGLQVMGMSNNSMVRFSLVLCIGLVVDNAIIVVENAYHHYQLGKDRITAVIDGTAEIAMPVISATLTTMAAFLPMLLMTGAMGEYMGILPKTVSLALSSSLIVALIANPLILSFFMKRGTKKGQILRPEDDLRRLKKIYTLVVSWALNHRLLVFVLMLASMAGATSLLGLKIVKVEMFPDIDFDYIYVTVETPPGTPVEITDGVARQVEAIVQEHVSEAVQVVATVGQRGQSAYELSTGIDEVISNFAEVTIELLDGKEFVRASHREIQDRIRPMLESIPGARIRFRPISWGPPIEAPILVKVRGQDLDVLRSITARVGEVMNSIDGIADIEDDFSDAPPELQVAIDRPKAAALGISMQAIAMSLRGATAGLDVRDFRDELDVSKKYDFKIIFAPQSRTSPNMLDTIKVRSDSGELIPLSSVVRVTQGEGLNSIRHADRRRIVRITASNRGRSAVEITDELIPILKKMVLPSGYSFDFSGEYEATQESFDSLKLAYVVAVLLILTLLVSQFNSIAQPFAIMCALPLSVVGALVGLWVTGNLFSIMSFIGLVGLCGIVVNDSIVLVDCVNRKRQEGMSMIDGIINGGIQRIRPIISTTLSTIGGIFTLTITDKLWEGLGVVIIFGIASATVLTLVVVPVMYSVFEGVRYYAISAFRGPRWKEAPTGRSFFFSRGKGAVVIIVMLTVFQLALLLIGIGLMTSGEFRDQVVYIATNAMQNVEGAQNVDFGKLIHSMAPALDEDIRTTVLRATTWLKLGLEVGVFYTTLALKALGYLALLLIPTWIGLVFLMAKRSREEYYVDITPEGMTMGSPVDRFFIGNKEIRKVRRGFLFPSTTLIVFAGRRKLILRKLIEANRTPGKKSLFKWLRQPSPSRKQVRAGMQELKKALEAQIL